MANISTRHKAYMEDLFEMGTGWVLNFTNATFSNFIAGITDIDVYNQDGYKDQPSKAKKLRFLFGHEDDEMVGKVILELLELREVIQEKRKEFDYDYIDGLSDKADEIKNMANKMIDVSAEIKSNEERLNIDIKTAKIVLEDLVDVCGKLALNATYNAQSLENSINDYFRDMLSSKGYDEVKDQSRHGVSVSHKDAGEVDLLLTKDGKETAIFEGLKLTCVDTSYIETHIDKAIDNYNSLGTATFIVAYISSANFADFWNRYYKYLCEYEFKLDKKRDVTEMTFPNASTRVCNTILSKDEYDFPVYFIAVNVN